MNFLLYSLSVLILTIIIEFIIYAIAMRENYGWLFLYSVLINGLTNPLANLSLVSYMNVFVIEILVFVVEIVLIKKLFDVSYKKAAIISLIANIISFVIGFFIIFKGFF